MPSVFDVFPNLDDSLTPNTIQTDPSPSRLSNIGNDIWGGISSAVSSLPGAPSGVDRYFPPIQQKPLATDFLDSAARENRFSSYAKGVIGNEYSPYSFEKLGTTADEKYGDAVESAKAQWSKLYPDVPWGAKQDNYLRQKALAYDMAHRFATTGSRGQMQMRGALSRMDEDQRAIFESALQEVADWQKNSHTDRFGDVGQQERNDSFLGQLDERVGGVITKGIQDNWNAWGDKETGYQLTKNRRVTDAAQQQAGPALTGHGSWGEFSASLPRAVTLAAAEQAPDIALSTTIQGAAGTTGLPGAGKAAGVAYWYNRLYPDAYAGLRDAGFTPETAETAAHATSLINGAIEQVSNIVPIPGLKETSGRAIAKTWKEWAKNTGIEIAKRYGAEVGEEALQAITEESVKRVAQQFEPDVPLDAREQFNSVINQTFEAALTMVPMALGGNVKGLIDSAGETQAKMSADKTRLGRKQGVNDLVSNTDYVQGWAQRSPEQAATMAQTDTPSRSQWEAAGLPKGVSGTQRKAFADAVRKNLASPEQVARESNIPDTNPDTMLRSGQDAATNPDTNPDIMSRLPVDPATTGQVPDTSEQMAERDPRWSYDRPTQPAPTQRDTSTQPIASDPTPADAAETTDIQLGPVRKVGAADILDAPPAQKDQGKLDGIARKVIQSLNEHGWFTPDQAHEELDNTVDTRLMDDSSREYLHHMIDVEYTRNVLDDDIADQQHAEWLANRGEGLPVGGTAGIRLGPVQEATKPVEQQENLKEKDTSISYKPTLGKRLTDTEIAAIREQEQRDALTARKNDPEPAASDLVPPAKPATTLGKRPTISGDVKRNVASRGKTTLGKKALTPEPAQDTMQAKEGGDMEAVAKPRPSGARKATAAGAARQEAARQMLQDAINNPDLVGKQRADTIANLKELVAFYQANAGSDKPLDTAMRNGDEIAYTGVVTDDGFREFIYLDGAKAGAYGQAMTEAEKESSAKAKQDNEREIQEGFARLHAKAKTEDEATATDSVHRSRHTPSPGTPERDAIESAYQDHQQNMARLTEEYEKQDAIRKKFKPSTKKFQAADEKIDEINNEINQRTTDNAKTIFAWRAARDEDSAVSAADEGNRLGYESAAAGHLRDAGLISRDQKDEIQNRAYETVRKLVAEEAKKQGVQSKNIDRVVSDIVPFVISYPSQGARNTIESRVANRAKTIVQDNIYDKAVEHVTDLEHIESGRKLEIKRELERWKDDSDKVTSIATEATAENLREKKNKEKVDELSKDTNVAITKSLAGLDVARTGPAVVLPANHAGADHRLVTNKKWMIDTKHLPQSQASSLKSRPQGVTISDKLLDETWDTFGGNKSKSSMDRLYFAGVRQTELYDKSKKKDVPYNSAILLDESGGVYQIDASLPAYLARHTKVDSAYVHARGKDQPSGIVFFAGDDVVAVTLASKDEAGESSIDVPTARRAIKDFSVPKTKLGKASPATQARTEADAAQADFEKEAQAGPQPAAAMLLPQGAPARPRNNTIHAAVQADNPEVERQLAESSGVSKDGILKKFAEAAPLAFKLATRAQEFLPNTPKWAADNEAFRLLKTIANTSQDEANRDIAAITDKLGAQPLQLFSRKIVIDNLYESRLRGEPLRFGFDSTEEVKQYKDKLDALAEQSPEVMSAIDTRKRIVKELAQQLVDAGLLDEKAIERADTYYHQQVLSKFEASRNHSGAGPKETKRGFQKRRVEGVEKFDEKLNYNTSYIEAEYEWMRDAHAQLRLEKWIRDLGRRHDIIEDVKKAAKDSGEDWRRTVRESGTHKIWQAEPGNVFYPAVGIDEQVVADVLAGISDTAEIGMDDLRSLIVLGGKRREMVLPNEIVDQLNAVQARSKIGQIGKVVRDIGNYWKVWTLLNPQDAAGYNLRNVTGDIDPVMGGAIGVLQPKYFGKSFGELRDYYGIMKQAKLSLSPELQAARDLGVIDSGMTSDIPDLEDLEIFKRFYTGQKKSLLSYGKLYFDKVKKYSTFRENLSRYAAFLYYRDALNAGTLAHYGGARKGIVDQLVKDMGVDVAAAHLSRNLLGDYGNLTVMGNWLRAYAMPFYAWTEVNLKRYPQIGYNAGMYGVRKFGKSPKAVAASVAAAGMIAVPYILMQAWNNLVWGDEEDSLSDDERASPHLILGKNDDGSLIILRNTGALGDFLEWFGLGTALGRVDEINAGQMGYGDLAQEALKQDVNKLSQSLRPDIKGIFEMSSGTTTFPDVFNPRKVRRDDMATGYLGLTDMYRGLRGAVTQDGSRVRPHFFQRMLGVTDPRRNALFEISELRDRYLKKLGQSGGFIPNLYFANMRDAAMNGDMEAFKEARTKWLTDGDTPGDYEKFKERLKGLDPLSEKMSDEKESDFVDNYLSAAQRDKLRMARDYAGQMQVEMWKMWNAAAIDDSGEVKAKINAQRVKEATSKARTLLALEPKSLTAKEKSEGITLGVKKSNTKDAARDAKAWIKDSGLEKAEVEDAVWQWIKDDLLTEKGRLEKMQRFQKEMGWSQWRSWRK